MTTGLPDIPTAVDERRTLVAFLDFYRAVARRKLEGLTDEQMRAPLAGHPSTLCVGGVVFHLASVEDWWFQRVLAGGEVPNPWRTAWNRDDNDFDFRVDHLTTDAVLAQYDASVEAARKVQRSITSLDDLVAVPQRDGSRHDVRWVLVHIVEEYARHCGHLDLLREALDGTTGD